MVNFKAMLRPRVLVVAMSGIGNLLMQTPLITKLKEANPASEISVLVSPRGTQDILIHNTKILDIIVGNAKPPLRNRIGMIQVIQKEKFDIGIVAFPGQLTMSSSLLYFGSVPTRIGHKYNYHFLKNTGLFLTNPISAQPVHDVRQNLNLLAPLGLDTNSSDTEYDFPVGEEDRLLAQKYLNENKLTKNILIGLHPGTNSDMAYKRWPVERWAKLADRLAYQFKAKILLFGNTDENSIKTEIAKLMRHKPVAVTQTLRGTAALIGKCAFFVSNDSGLMHVAVSQKVPTFGLFGPTDEGRTAPWGKFGRVIRAASTQPNYDVAKLREIKQRQTADETLLALNVEPVFNQIVKEIPSFSPSENNASS